MIVLVSTIKSQSDQPHHEKSVNTESQQRLIVTKQIDSRTCTLQLSQAFQSSLFLVCILLRQHFKRLSKAEEGKDGLIVDTENDLSSFHQPRLRSIIQSVKTHTGLTKVGGTCRGKFKQPSCFDATAAASKLHAASSLFWNQPRSTTCSPHGTTTCHLPFMQSQLTPLKSSGD